MSECSHDCNSCGADCGERTAQQHVISKENPHRLSNIKKVIGIVSGKGGVGKSLVTSMLAVLAQRSGKNAAVLDADITGPSIPKSFGIHVRAQASDIGMYPVSSNTGIKVMSLNLLTENETDPVIWRGPIIASAVKQFWTDVIWGDIDYMFVDMPPGTGDVPLTVFQSIPVDGIIVVASPQELVAMVVEKAVKMAYMMNVPIIGLVENMSYFLCPDCGSRHNIFGESHVTEIAEKHAIKTVSRLPIEPRLASLCDNGTIENFEGDWLNSLYKNIESGV